MVDMQGRLMGKRLHARISVETAHERRPIAATTSLATRHGDGHSPDRLRRRTKLAEGYGDIYVMKPDLSTAGCTVAWLEGTAMVMCDVLDHRSHCRHVPHSPAGDASSARISAGGAIWGFSPNGGEPNSSSPLRGTFVPRSARRATRLTPVSGIQPKDYHIPPDDQGRERDAPGAQRALTPPGCR